MDQTTGTTPPPVTDTPETSGQSTPPAAPTAGDTAAPTTPSTPPAESTAPSGPPPVEETPMTSTTDISAPPASETPATPTETQTAESTPAAPAAESGSEATSEDHSQTTASTPPASDMHDDKKSPSKPLMVVVGLLVVGALSAVFLVANMQPGDTQSSASRPTRAPALPTQAKAPMEEAMMMQTDPNLTITAPAQNAVVTVAAITVSGKTFPNADVFIGEKELKADAEGMFSTTVTLDEGENSILVISNDEDGNDAEQEIMVSYETE